MTSPPHRVPGDHGWPPVRHSPRRDREAISHHYDVGNEFYALLLGPSLATHVAVLEEAGFEVRDVEKLREHYALACRAWVETWSAGGTRRSSCLPQIR